MPKEGEGFVMRRGMKKGLCLLLVACTLLTLVPGAAFAAVMMPDNAGLSASTAIRDDVPHRHCCDDTTGAGIHTPNLATAVPLFSATNDDLTPGAISRVEWIRGLVALFDMEIDEESMPDDYFYDIEEDSEYWLDVMTATAFGIVNIEAGESFYPNAPVTREFAAQTMNFCLGFQVDEDDVIDFNDLDDLLHTEDAWIAVQRDWFPLVGGNFQPNALVTRAQMDTIFEDAAEVWTSTEIDPNHDDMWVFEDGVIVIPNGTEVDYDDGTVIIHNSPRTIAVGQVFVVYFFDVPVAYTALSVSVSDGVTTIITEEKDTMEILLEANAQGVMEADLTLAEPYDEYTTITYIEGGTAALNFADGIEHASITPFNVTSVCAININRRITVSPGVTVTVGATISNIAIEHRLRFNRVRVDEVHFVVTGTSTATINASASTGALPRSVTLATVPVKGIGNITVAFEYSLSGSATITFSADFSAGLNYTRGNGFRTIRSFRERRTSIYAQASLGLGLRVTAGLRRMPVISGHVYAHIGVNAYGETRIHNDGQMPNRCTHFEAYVFASVGARARLCIRVWSRDFGESIPIWTRTNPRGPARVVLHWDDGRPVASCVRGGNRFFTPINSRFGGISGGSGISGNWRRPAAAVVVPVFTYTISNNEATVTGFTGRTSTLVIPETLGGHPVTAIGDNAFENRNDLVVIIIPDSVTEIGWGAFAGTTNLSSVTLSRNLETLRELAFYNTTSLTTIEIPRSLTAVWSFGASGPFANSGLRTATFEQGITHIPDNLFKGANNLEMIIIPNTVVEIGNSAFEYTNLHEIIIPDSVTEIGDWAFANNTSLINIVIPRSVINIGENAFRYRSPNLTIYCYANSYAHEYAVRHSIRFVLLGSDTTPPTVPQNFTATPGNGQVTLAWTAPANDGGSVIIRFEVSSDNGSTWVTASSNTGHTFTGLTNGVTYTFRVRAVNSAGNGAEASVTANSLPDDRTSLQALVLQTTERNRMDYIIATWRAVVEAHRNAESILADATATQEQVDAAYNALKNAKDALVAIASIQHPFVDVTTGAWYWGAVRFAYANDIVGGTSDTTFSPDGTLTRGMMVTILYNLYGRPEVTTVPTFYDVAAGAWYADAIVWASENGIVAGVGGNNFAPGANINREQLATIIRGFAEFQSIDVTPRPGPYWNDFTDHNQISWWALDSLIWANYHEIVNGMPGPVITPDGNASRAQAVAIIMNFMNAFGDL